jgi:hypothetical protein
MPPRGCLLERRQADRPGVADGIRQVLRGGADNLTEHA